MVIEEVKVRLWLNTYIKTGNEKAFEKIWTQVRFLVTNPPSTSYVGYSNDYWDSVKKEAVFVGCFDYDPNHEVVEKKPVEIFVENTVLKPKTISIIKADGSITEKVIQVPTKVREKKIRIIELRRKSEMTVLSYLRFCMNVAIQKEINRIISVKKMESVSLDSTFDNSDGENPVSDKILFNMLQDPGMLNTTDAISSEDQFMELIPRVDGILAEGDKLQYEIWRLKLENPGISNRDLAVRLNVSKTTISTRARQLKHRMIEILDLHHDEEVYA